METNQSVLTLSNIAFMLSFQVSILCSILKNLQIEQNGYVCMSNYTVIFGLVVNDQSSTILTDICSDNDSISGWRCRIIKLIDNIQADLGTFSHCILRLTELDSCNYETEREREREISNLLTAYYAIM